jgi:hypothetical protein
MSFVLPFPLEWFPLDNESFDLLKIGITGNCGLCDHAYVNNTKICTYNKGTKEHTWHIPQGNIENEIKSKDYSLVLLLWHNKRDSALQVFFDFKNNTYARKLYFSPLYVKDPSLS